MSCFLEIKSNKKYTLKSNRIFFKNYSNWYLLLTYLKKKSFDEGIYSWSEAIPIFFINPDSSEAPQKDPSFTKYWKEIQHVSFSLFKSQVLLWRSQYVADVCFASDGLASKQDCLENSVTIVVVSRSSQNINQIANCLDSALWFCFLRS